MHAQRVAPSAIPIVGSAFTSVESQDVDSNHPATLNQRKNQTSEFGTGSIPRTYRHALDLADYRDDLAQHRCIIARDRIERWVVWHEPYLSSGPSERLYRGFAVEHRCDDIPILGDILLPDHYPVTVADRGFDHRLADHFEQEEISFADQFTRQWKDVFDGLFCKNRPARGDSAQDRHESRLRKGFRAGELGQRCKRRIPGGAYIHGPRTIRIAT